MVRLYSVKKRTCFLLVNIFVALCVCTDSVQADHVWDSYYGRFMSIGNELKATDKEQYAYIQELIEAEDTHDAVLACNTFIHHFPLRSSLLRDSAV